MYSNFIRPLLFLFDPEAVHHFTFKALKFFYKIPGVAALSRKRYQVKDKSLEREVFGLKFPNPVGLAAGFDKDAKAYKEFSNLGFGFIEIGTLTPKPQEGNPKQRLFRLKKDGAIINRMGFNNKGVLEAVERLKSNQGAAHKVLIGGNIGKNKVTANQDAVEDYIICFEALFPYVDYFVVNVSSPNTPGLRDLQDKKPLTALLNSLQELNGLQDVRKPMLLKIAPDLTDGQLQDIIEIVSTTKIDGIIATNTTIARDGLHSEPQLKEQAGGLSGAPLTNRATQVIEYLHRNSNGAFPIIGVGGIMSAQDAIDKLRAGASLIQLYSGFIYEGPGLIKRINKAIIRENL